MKTQDKTQTIDTPNKRRACVDRFEEIAESYDLTNHDLAELIEVSPGTISKWLTQRDPTNHINYIL